MGCTPNTDDLGLEKSGVACDDHGYILVDNQLRTNVPGIWALGDCNGRGGFTHTSYNVLRSLQATSWTTIREASTTVSPRIASTLIRRSGARA